MKWKGNTNYMVCGKPETTNHILFDCVMAKLTWGGLKDACEWTRPPTSLQYFSDYWLPLGAKSYSLKLLMLAAVMWSLWTTRNKIVVDGAFPKSTTEIFFKILVVLQKWRARLKQSEKAELDNQVAQVKGWLEEFVKKIKARTSEDWIT
jgi:hypothetical protein